MKSIAINAIHFHFIISKFVDFIRRGEALNMCIWRELRFLEVPMNQSKWHLTLHQPNDKLPYGTQYYTAKHAVLRQLLSFVRWYHLSSLRHELEPAKMKEITLPMAFLSCTFFERKQLTWFREFLIWRAHSRWICAKSSTSRIVRVFNRVQRTTEPTPRTLVHTERTQEKRLPINLVCCM